GEASVGRMPDAASTYGVLSISLGHHQIAECRQKRHLKVPSWWWRATTRIPKRGDDDRPPGGLRSAAQSVGWEDCPFAAFCPFGKPRIAENRAQRGIDGRDEKR